MTQNTFHEDILAGIPAVLPEPKPYDTKVSHAPKRKVVSSSLAGGAKHRDFTVNHGVFLIIGPIIKLSSQTHQGSRSSRAAQMDSNTIFDFC